MWTAHNALERTLWLPAVFLLIACRVLKLFSLALFSGPPRVSTFTEPRSGSQGLCKQKLCCPESGTIAVVCDLVSPQGLSEKARGRTAWKRRAPERSRVGSSHVLADPRVEVTGSLSVHSSNPTPSIIRGDRWEKGKVFLRCQNLEFRSQSPPASQSPLSATGVRVGHLAGPGLRFVLGIRVKQVLYNF